MHKQAGFQPEECELLSIRWTILQLLLSSSLFSLQLSVSLVTSINSSTLSSSLPFSLSLQLSSTLFIHTSDSRIRRINTTNSSTTMLPTVSTVRMSTSSTREPWKRSGPLKTAWL